MQYDQNINADVHVLLTIFHIFISDMYFMCVLVFYLTLTLSDDVVAVGTHNQL